MNRFMRLPSLARRSPFTHPSYLRCRQFSYTASSMAPNVTLYTAGTPNGHKVSLILGTSLEGVRVARVELTHVAILEFKRSSRPRILMRSWTMKSRRSHSPRTSRRSLGISRYARRLSHVLIPSAPYLPRRADTLVYMSVDKPERPHPRDSAPPPRREGLCSLRVRRYNFVPRTAVRPGVQIELPCEVG